MRPVNRKRTTKGKQETRKPTDSTAEYERALAGRDEQVYVLRLYISGVSPKSVRALTNLKKFCEEHLAGRYELEVIDVYQQPALAAGEQIVAVPTLIKKLPAPLRRMIGDMSDTERILVGIDLKPKK